MLSVMHSETVEAVSPINPEILTSAINRAIHRGVVLIAEIDGKILEPICWSIGFFCKKTDWSVLYKQKEV